MPTTTNGITYPASTDHVRLWEHLQTLAADVDRLSPKCYQAYASTDLSLSTARTDVPGATVTFTTAGAAAVAVVTAVWDFEVTSWTALSLSRGYLAVDGTDQAQIGISSNVVNGQRYTVAQTYRVALTTPGSHTLKLRADRSSSANTLTCKSTHTSLQVLVLNPGA